MEPIPAEGNAEIIKPSHLIMRDTEVSGHRLDHGHELSLSSSPCLLTSIRCSSNLAAYRWECLSMHWELGEPGIRADRFSHVSLALFLPKSGFLIPPGGHCHGVGSVPSKNGISRWKVLLRSACQAFRGHCSFSLSLS